MRRPRKIDLDQLDAPTRQRVESALETKSTAVNFRWRPSDVARWRAKARAAGMSWTDFAEAAMESFNPERSDA